MAIKKQPPAKKKPAAKKPARKASTAPGSTKRKKCAKPPTRAQQRATATTAKKRAFLKAFAEEGTVTYAAAKAKVDRTTPYRWADEDDAFADAWRVAQEQAADALELEARRRAISGTDEPVFYQGAPVGHIRRYSDTLLIFLLKGARPQKYRERHELSGADGGPIPVKTEGKVEHDVAGVGKLAQVLGLLTSVGAVPPPEPGEDGGA